jgi:hypothetical protein
MKTPLLPMQIASYQHALNNRNSSKPTTVWLTVFSVACVVLCLLPAISQASVIDRHEAPPGYTQNTSTYRGTVQAMGSKQGLHQTGNYAALRNRLTLCNTGLEIGGMAHNPVKKLVFSLSNTATPAGFVRLELDGLYGVSTQEAHRLGQQASNYISSPTTLKVNGVRVHHFTLNTNQTIQLDIPVSLLKAKGFNTLQLEAGYYFDENNALAYDEVSTGGIRLVY